jgi:hypothetical protein
VWSIVAPEILDFRMAPLWGLLLAATAAIAPARGGSGSQTPAPSGPRSAAAEFSTNQR